MNKERLQELSKDQVKLIISLINSEIDELIDGKKLGFKFHTNHHTQLKEIRNVLEWSLGQWVSERKKISA